MPGFHLFFGNFSEKRIERPLLVFDAMGLVRKFGETQDECILGGRHKKYQQKATEFFQKLKSLGFLLVFVCDGSLQPERVKSWCDRRAREYKEVRATLSKINSRRYRCSNKNNGEGCYYFANGLLEIAKQFGTVIHATEHDCDSTAAQYATNNNALAIITNDSDFLFHDGDWQHWHMKSMDMENLTVGRFNRNALIDQWQVTREQLKAFATIAGNDYTKKLPWRVHGDSRQFESIANFCRYLNTTRNDAFYWNITKYMCGRRKPLPEWIDTVKLGIESYSIDFQLPLEACVGQNMLMTSILENKIFQYTTNYLFYGDDNSNVADNIFETLRRLSGVLLYHRQRERKTFQLLTKRSREAIYRLESENSEFPTFLGSPPMPGEIICLQFILNESKCS